MITRELVGQIIELLEGLEQPPGLTPDFDYILEKLHTAFDVPELSMSMFASREDYENAKFARSDKITIERETLKWAIRWHESRIWPGPDEVSVFDALRAALAAQPACSPTLTECPRCKNDIGKCDGMFAAGDTPFAL